MDKQDSLKDDLYIFMYDNIFEFKNLSMDRQGEIVCQIYVLEKDLQNIVLENYDKDSQKKKSIFRRVKEMISELEEEGIFIKDIPRDMLFALNRFLIFMK